MYCKVFFLLSKGPVLLIQYLYDDWRSLNLVKPLQTADTHADAGQTKLGRNAVNPFGIRTNTPECQSPCTIQDVIENRLFSGLQ